MTTVVVQREGSIGICGLLLVAFIVLKLCAVIDWSWWWVTAPLWMPIALVLAIVAVVGLFAMLAWMLGGKVTARGSMRRLRR